MLNTQPIEKQDLSSSTLNIHSIFLTIQGEGPFAGEPAVFIRLNGCNLQCPLCDTDYTSRSEMLDHWAILDKVSSSAPPNKLVIITGGEPFRQNLNKAVHILLQHGYRVQIETNGTLFQELPYHYQELTIVCAPKTGKVNKDLLPHIKAFKYVIDESNVDVSDGLPSTVLGHSASPKVARPPEWFKGKVYVQPADEQDPLKNVRNRQAAIWSAMAGGYTLCLQLHKIIGME